MAPGTPAQLGSEAVLEVGQVAHGGHCVARLDGQVVFVRHALPGERVLARLEEAGGGGRYLRAETLEVLEPAPGRVEPPCAHAARCGGCDWQHAAPATQRELKSHVVGEALSRALHRQVDASVEAVPGDQDGLGWRTRVRLAVGADGHAGFRGHRSHEIVPIDDCPLAHPDLRLADVLARDWSGREEVVVEVDGRGGRVVSELPGPRPAPSVRRAAGRDWVVPGGGFWQVHPGAADALVDAVRDAVRPAAGEHLVDLYSGVGLIGGSLGADVGVTGRVDLVESGRAAVRAAGENLADLPQCRVHFGQVEPWLGERRVRRADVVVLDPPRSGAGPRVLRRCATLQPRVICYVACDPASLARDAAALAEAGYELTGLRAFDLFPMTAHVECVATFGPAATAQAG